MRALSQTPRVRIAVAAGGAILMVGAALVGLGGTWLFANAWPNGQPEGLNWLLVPFAPLTAVTILVSGALWTRSLRPSMLESFGSLLIVEVVAWGIVVYYNGDLFTFLVFMFWAGVSLVFAPWWLLGFWIGRAIDRKRHGESSARSS